MTVDNGMTADTETTRAPESVHNGGSAHNMVPARGSVGVPELDQQHEQILDQLQRAQDELCRGGSDGRGFASALTELRGLVMFHFTFEEMHLRSAALRDGDHHGADPRGAEFCGSHLLAEHLRDHADFLAALNDLSSPGTDATDRLRAALPELDRWIREHIAAFDVPGLASVEHFAAT